MTQVAQRLVARRPVAVLVSAFLALILAISALVFIFELEANKLSYTDAFFTSVSASTVTGLTVISTSALTLASQAAILAGIQIGGLVIYLGAYVIFKVAGLRGKSAAELLAQVSWKDIKTIIFFSLFVELLGAAGYFFVFRGDMGVSQAVYYSIFHSVSAYCNAGFFLFSDNFYSVNPAVLLIAMGEITLGGIGFVVIIDMEKRVSAAVRRENFPRLQPESRIMIAGTIFLVLLGFAAFWLLEADGLLAGKSFGDSALTSLFQSVSARTAGFSAVDLSAMDKATYFLFMFLMFIGAGPVSMSGGVKITTVAVVLLSSLFALRGKEQVIVWGSEISEDNIRRALRVLFWYGLILFMLVFVLLAVEPSVPFEDSLFDAFSASGTVGLSSGAVEQFSAGGKILLTLLMFAGRIGPLTLTYLFANKMISQRVPWTLSREVHVG